MNLRPLNPAGGRFRKEIRKARYSVRFAEFQKIHDEALQNKPKSVEDFVK